MKEVCLPKLGVTMEAGTVARWLKREGEKVHQGEPLVEVETDKVLAEVEAPADGILREIFVAEGEEVAVGTVIGVIGEADETLAIDKPVIPTSKRAPAMPERATLRQAENPSRDDFAGRPKASPAARRLAREKKIDLRDLTGSGPDGRIVAADVLQAAQSKGR